ncbi:MAG: beta-propeller domain-containing protein [Nitriliruptor sp.]
MRNAVAAVGAVAVFAAGVALGQAGAAPPPERPRPTEGAPVALGDRLELAGALTSFDACDDYLAHVQGRALERVTAYGLGGGPGWYAVDGVERAIADAGGGAEAGEDAAASVDTQAAPTAGTTPDGVSGTNVQEQGVDEPDRVKTDGDTMYVVTEDRLRIIDLRDDQPAELAQVPLGEGGWGAELLLAGDRLLVTSAHGGLVPFAGERIAGDIAPSGGATTTLTSIDVSDPTAPEVTERLILDGATLTSRMVEGTARVVIRTEAGAALPWEHPQANGLRAEREALAANRELIETSEAIDWLPYLVHETADGERREGTLVPCERVAQPREFAGLGLISVLTVDVADGALRPDRGAMAVLTAGETIYASTGRLYVATQRWRDDPRLEGGAGSPAPADDIEIEPRFPDRDGGPDVTTEIHAFATDDPTTTEYLGSGAVDGTLLSQWAMSEHDGILRVASTIGDPWSAASSESSVTTLELRDGELTELGRVDGLGPTETIRAVRFLGDVGYVVTFRQTDPLYTVDLSDPATPSVVGELKIPGYSGYLHPVGEGQLIGVGQDADEEGMTLGAQVSLFDVSDPADPRRTDTVTVPRSESPVEWDHRSFLHWPATGLTVVPVTRHHWGEPGEPKPVGPTSGALALVAEDGSLRAAGDHAPDQLVLNHADGPAADATGAEITQAFERGYLGAISRAVVAGDRLITVSERGIIVHDLTTLADRGALGF